MGESENDRKFCGLLCSNGGGLVVVGEGVRAEGFELPAVMYPTFIGLPNRHIWFNRSMA